MGTGYLYVLGIWRRVSRKSTRAVGLRSSRAARNGAVRTSSSAYHRVEFIVPKYNVEHNLIYIS